jgi:hypothetical protein
MQRETFMKEIGKMICNTAREKKLAMMDLNTKGNTSKEKNQDKACMFGQMVKFTEASGKIMKSLARDGIIGQTVETILVT